MSGYSFTASSTSGVYILEPWSMQQDDDPPPGGVREPRRPKPPKLSPGTALEAPDEDEGLRVIGVVFTEC